MVLNSSNIAGGYGTALQLFELVYGGSNMRMCVIASKLQGSGYGIAGKQYCNVVLQWWQFNYVNCRMASKFEMVLCGVQLLARPKCYLLSKLNIDV